MSKNFVLSVLILFVILTFGKILNPYAMMMFLILAIGLGAVYLSGFSFRSLFQKSLSIKSLDEMMKMTPYAFEGYVADYFRAAGYTVFQTKRSRDGGKDLVMYKNGQTFFVEVKKYARSNHIQRPLIQKLVGACHPEGARGIFVTTSSFSKGAIDEAYRSNIRLIDGKEFVKLVKSCI